MTPAPLPLPPGVTADDVRRCLDAILASPQFASSERLKRFLVFAIEQSLSSAEGPKEYEVGVHVYDRGTEFDPSRDSIVRTEAARLRKRLAEYYGADGASSSIRVRVPRGSYRVHVEQGSDTTPSDDAIADASEESAPPRRHDYRAWVLSAGIGAVVLLAVWTTRFTGANVAPPNESRGYVLIGKVLNHTGNQRLDGAVESGIELFLTQLGGSQPLPTPRIDDALRLMTKSVDTDLSPRIAREVALRDGEVRAIVHGSLEGVAPTFKLAVLLSDPSTSRVLGSVTREATEGQLSVVARDVARWINTRMSGGMRSDEGLQPVTTSSLRAVQLYSEAYKEGLRGRWAHAERLLEQSLVEDEHFASAYLLLAWARRNQDGPSSTWQEPLAQAIAKASRSTEAERLFILGSSHTMASRDREARVVYESLLRLSPDHYWARNNLLNALAKLDHTNAAFHMRRLADLRPRDARIQAGLAWAILMQSDEMEQATLLMRRARELPPPEDTFLLPALEAFEAWARGDTARAVSLTQAIPPRTPLDHPVRYALRVGLPLAGLGMTARAADAVSGLPLGAAARWEGWLALLAGDMDRARSTGDRVVKAPANALNAILLARLGRVGDAETVIGRNREVYGVGYNAALHEAVWNVARAEVLVRQGQASRAEPLLAASIAELEPFYGTHIEYFLAIERMSDVLEATGRREAARTLLERAVARRGRAFAIALPFWTVCARRLERRLNDDGHRAAAATLRLELDRQLSAADPPRQPPRTALLTVR